MLLSLVYSVHVFVFIFYRSLAVAEEKNSRVQILSTRTGKGKACLDRSSAPGLGGPTTVNMSSDGQYMLVADVSSVHYFNLRGEHEYVWPSDVGPRHGGGRGPDKGTQFQKINGMSADCFDNLVIADNVCEARDTLWESTARTPDKMSGNVNSNPDRTSGSPRTWRVTNVWD